MADAKFQPTTELGQPFMNLRQTTLRIRLAIVILIGFATAALTPGQALAQAPDRETVLALRDRFTELYEKDEYAAAEPVGLQVLAAVEQDPDAKLEWVAAFTSMMAQVYQHQNTPEKTALADKYYALALKRYRELPKQATEHFYELAQRYAWFKAMEGDYASAVPLMEESVATARRYYGKLDRHYAQTLLNAGAMRMMIGDPQGAVELSRTGLAIYQQLGADTFDALNNLGIAYQMQEHFAEAESHHRAALALLEGTDRRDTADYALTLSRLGSIASQMRDDRRAMDYYQRALAIYRELHGESSTEYADALQEIARYHERRGDLREAQRYFVANVAARRTIREGFSGMAFALDQLGQIHTTLHDYERALPALEEALEIAGENFGEVSSDIMLDLARLHFCRGDVKQAEPLLKKALAAKQKQRGGDHTNYAFDLRELADLFCELNNVPRALPLYEEAVRIEERSGTHPTQQCRLYLNYARALWQTGDRKAAIERLTRALKLAEDQRGKSAGGDEDRSRFFGGFQDLFEQMLAWQLELGSVADAFAAHERGRARSLVDQMRMQQVDLLASVPKQLAGELRQRDAAATAEMAVVERQLKLLPDSTDEASVNARRKLEGRLAAARERMVDVYREMRNASPAYQLAVNADYRPLALDELNPWVAKEQGLLVEYAIGERAGVVFIVDGVSPPRAEPLALAEAQAERCGVAAGPLTQDKLAALWRVGDGDLIGALASPRTASAAAERLALLWELLIPKSLRSRLNSDAFRRVYIIPDGLLATLPFETLIVKPGSQPEYLLDVCPPLIYAPSSSVLVNLQASRPASGRFSESQQPVLTVANPQYRAEAANAGLMAPLNSERASSRFYRGHGSLAALPYTNLESQWVAAVFQKAEIAAAALRGAQATELNARGNVGNRSILHFACHGLVDQEFGNFFGSLALTPGPSSAPATNDGFLTLPEIYELPLAGCELAILSACQTNVGPNQRGEGLYGLSRGFLVAGARRVVASNWLVDDEAAASLVSYFCGAIAAAEKSGAPVDYAQALHEARRWTRQQAKWSSPYYWGTFVLIGPN